VLSVELTKTVQRLSALIPQIALALGIEVTASSHTPKPLRAVRPPTKKLPPKPPTTPAAVSPKPVLEAATVAPDSPVKPEAEVEVATENVQAPLVTEAVEDVVVEPTVD